MTEAEMTRMTKGWKGTMPDGEAIVIVEDRGGQPGVIQFAERGCEGMSQCVMTITVARRVDDEATYGFHLDVEARDALLDLVARSAGIRYYQRDTTLGDFLADDARPTHRGIRWMCPDGVDEPTIGIRQCTGQGDGCNGVVIFTRGGARGLGWVRTHLSTAVSVDLAALMAASALGQEWR